MNGNLIRRVTSQGALNSPWGLALAPSQFGALAGDLLIGNFGDGTINAYDPVSGNFWQRSMAPMEIRSLSKDFGD